MHFRAISFKLREEKYFSMYVRIFRKRANKFNYISNALVTETKYFVCEFRTKVCFNQNSETALLF